LLIRVNACWRGKHSCLPAIPFPGISVCGGLNPGFGDDDVGRNPTDLCVFRTAPVLALHHAAARFAVVLKATNGQAASPRQPGTFSPTLLSPELTTENPGHTHHA